MTKQTLNGNGGAKWASVVTNLTKLAGLVIAGNEALIRTQPTRPIVLAIAAFMMAGAQGLETFLDKFFGR